MKWNGNRNNKSLKWKLAVLIVAVILLVGLIALQINQRKKERSEYKKIVEQEELQKQERKKEGKKENINLENTDQEKSDTDICIVNLEEFAEALMGENTYLLTERLAGWVEENQLNAKEGTIFHVMVPESDPQSINFYIRLSDKRSSLVMLSYHPRENIVTASICNYTEDEIKNEVWEADNGPAQRDVPAEEDTGGMDAQEGTDDDTGED